MYLVMAEIYSTYEHDETCVVDKERTEGGITIPNVSTFTARHVSELGPTGFKQAVSCFVSIRIQ